VDRNEVGNDSDQLRHRDATELLDQSRVLCLTQARFKDRAVCLNRVIAYNHLYTSLVIVPEQTVAISSHRRSSLVSVKEYLVLDRYCSKEACKCHVKYLLLVYQLGALSAKSVLIRCGGALVVTLDEATKRKPIAQGRNILDVSWILGVWFYLAPYPAD
jgi:hypothetical protein